MNSKRTLVGLASLLCAMVASACVNAPSGPSTSATATGPQGSSPVPTVIGGASASPTAVAATIDVSPAEQRIGGLNLSLSFEPPRHMVDQATVNAAAAQAAAAASSASNPDAAQPTASALGGTNKGAVVMADMLKVTNNIDATQALPVDTATTVVRHVVVGVKTGDGAAVVPYLGVSMDILLDGHPLGFGQAVVPMVATDATVPTLYYGNNVRLGQRGLYQVFIRLTRNPLLGSDTPQAGQFNVQVR